MRRQDAVQLVMREEPASGVLRLHQQWSVLGAENVVMLRPKPHDFSLESPKHYLALLNAYRLDGETFTDGLTRSTLRDGREKLIFIPAGCRLRGWSQPGAASMAFTAAYLDPEVCSWLDAASPQLYPLLHFENCLLAQIMTHLDQVLADPPNYSSIYAESLAIVMTAEIVKCQLVAASKHRGNSGASNRGGLAAWQLRAVCEYMEEHLSEDISLADLAAIAKLSPYHFCRAFKRAVGVPPHRYQIGRRIEHAKQLLVTPTVPIADIARGAGYSSSGRFSKLFKQATGFSPSEYRKRLL